MVLNPIKISGDSRVHWWPASVTSKTIMPAEDANLCSDVVKLNDGQSGTFITNAWSASFNVGADVGVTNAKESDAAGSVSDDRGLS